MDALIAYPLPGNTGYTWTIASRISDALQKAESLYGERDKEYFLAGFEFTQTIPAVWYPGDRKHIVIQLSAAAKENFAQAIYQIAHEVIHLLAPSGGKHSNVLEEGLAQHFSELYAREATGVTWNPTVPAYALARDLVRRLLEIDSAAIRRLRLREPKLFRVSSDLITSEITAAPKELADALAAPFVRQ